jgi:Icc-related predicted phosphoesterase
MNILVVSDWEEQLIYSEKMKYRMNDIDLVISCGDLSFSYLDFIMSELNKPVFYVVGNHLSDKYYKRNMENKAILQVPACFNNLHLKSYTLNKNLLIAGFEGSGWYNGGPFQYQQWEVFVYLIKLFPKLIYNKLKYGRFLDIFVTHAPLYHVGDLTDLCHRGLKGFNWFLRLFKPKYHLHGHIHIHDINQSREKDYHGTKVINCSGFYKLEIPDSQLCGGKVE